MGSPPFAYISERELAAAIAPKSYGELTIGVKKSTVKRNVSFLYR